MTKATSSDAAAEIFKFSSIHCVHSSTSFALILSTFCRVTNHTRRHTIGTPRGRKGEHSKQPTSHSEVTVSRIDDCCQLLLHSLTFPSFLFSPHSFPPLFRVIPCPHSLPMRSRPATATLQGYDFVRDIRNLSEKAKP